MPTNRTRRSRKYTKGLTGQQEEHLLVGCILITWYENPGVEYPFKNEAERKKLYKQHRDFLFTRCSPGEKPDAYYDYEGDREEEAC